jgi:hypothetical protein
MSGIAAPVPPGRPPASGAGSDAGAAVGPATQKLLEHLHDEGAVLVVDETGDVKKGARTVGVQRQYTGTAGRVENAQVAVYLVYAGLRGHAAVDRELYMPHSWTRDPDRCRAAGLDEDTVFATEPEPAARTIGRFLDARHRAAPHREWTLRGLPAQGRPPRTSAAAKGYDARWARTRAAYLRATPTASARSARPCLLWSGQGRPRSTTATGSGRWGQGAMTGRTCKP